MTTAATGSVRVAGMVPRRLWVHGAAPAFRGGSGAILFADIVGFTALTEAARRAAGARGIEDLTVRLNRVFGEMVAAVHAAGGDVLKFGGDALLVAFDQDSSAGGEALARAIWCADQLRRAVARRRQVVGKRLSLHIGMAAGQWSEHVVGQPGTRREHFVSGSAVARAIAASGLSQRGVSVLDASRQDLPSMLPVKFRPGGRNIWLLDHPRRPWGAGDAPQPFEESCSSGSCDTGLWDFIPILLRPLLGQANFDPLRAAEHRRVCTLFVFWRGCLRCCETPDAAVWQDVFDAAFEPILEAKGLWARSDPGGQYQKLLVLFGSPHSADDDAERAMDCALALRNRFAVMREKYPRLRVGIGMCADTVFTGWVGGQERYEFTAMGHGINLAARLAAHAPPGIIQVERGTRTGVRGFRFATGPELRLKGVRRPVVTFRLRERTEYEPVADMDAPIEHSGALASAVRIWSDAPHDPIRISVPAGADGRRFVHQLIDSLALPVRSVSYFCFQAADGNHPHGGLRRLLNSLGGDTPDVGSVCPASGVDAPDRRVLDCVYGTDQELGAAIRGMGRDSWIDRVADVVARSGLFRVSDGSARVIVLDQLQRASDIDRGVLNKLALRSDGAWRLIMLCEGSTPAADAVDAPMIVLGPLTKADFRQFVQQLLRKGIPSARLLDYLYGRSGGMARLARLYLDNMRDEGLLTEPRGCQGVWKLNDEAAACLPEGLRAHYIHRIDRLPACAGTVARAVAVLGDAAPTNAVQALCRGVVPTGDWHGAVTTLRNSGLVEEAAVGEQTALSFVDSVCRQAVYETMSYAVRESWHRQAADLWRTSGTRQEELIGEHLFRARDPAALPWLERAARRARRLWLLDRARLLLRWSLLAACGRCDPGYKRIVPPLPTALDVRQRRLLAALADVLKVQGLYPDAGTIFGHLAREAAGRGDSAHAAEHMLAAARVDWYSGHYKRTQRRAAQVLRLAQLSRAPRLAGHAQYLRGETARRTGHVDAARLALQQAIHLAEKTNDRVLQVDSWNALGLLSWSRGRLEEARDCFRAALRALPRAGRGDPAKRGQIANNLGILLEEYGRLPAAERYYQRALEAFSRIGARRSRAYSLGNLANLYRHAGKYERARAAYEEVALELRSIGEPHAAAYTIGNLGDLARDFGDLAAASELYDRTLRYARHVGDAELIAESYARLAEIQLARRRLKDARNLLRLASSAARKAQSREFALRAHLLRAEVDLAGGFVPSAQGRFGEAGRQADRAGLLYYRLWALHGVGSCLLRSGIQREALKLAGQGVSLAQRSGYRWWELRFAVMGAPADNTTVADNDPPGARRSAMTARAAALIADFEASIGDPRVRESFRRLPLIQALPTPSPVSVSG